MSVNRAGEYQDAQEPDKVGRSAVSPLLRLTQKVASPLEDTASRRERQIHAIRRVSEAAFAYDVVDELVREALEVAVDVLKADVGSVQLYEPRNDTLVFRHAVDPRAPALIGTAIPTSQGIGGWVFRSGVSDLSLDVNGRDEWNPSVDQQMGYQTHSMLTVPIRSHHGPPLGIMQLLNGRTPFDESDLEVLEVLCDQVAQAISQTRLREEANRRLVQAQTLRSMDLALSSHLDLGVVVHVLTEQALAHLHADAANVMQFQSQTRMLHQVAARGFRSVALRLTRLPLGKGHPGRAALERQILSVPDFPNDPGDAEHAELLEQEEFTSYVVLPLMARGQLQGVLEIFYRTPFEPSLEWLDFARDFAVQAALALDNAALFGGLQELNVSLAIAYDSTLEGFARALDLRAREPEGHTQRVVELTLKLAHRMGVPDAEMAHLRRGALLHDIGKMGVPDAILLKPTPLTEEEWTVLKKHPVYAYELLSPVAYLRPALDIPYCHHERWDGSGYPRGLRGEQIPLNARIFALVDAWDTMRADRPYRLGWPVAQASAHIQRASGTQFDPAIVDAFVTMMESSELLGQ